MNSDDIFRLYPRALKNDKTFYALGRVIADYLSRNCKLMSSEIIYAVMEELPEDILDALAYELKIDWYEYSAPIENKRCAIKEAMFVHRYKGTKYAVETALHSVFTDAKVEEWFEYNGEPFHFKLMVYGGSGSSNLKSLVARIQYAKNLRSVMDNIVFIILPNRPVDIFTVGKIIAQNKVTSVVARFTGDSMSIRATPIYAAAKSCVKIKTIHATVIV